MRKTDRNFEMFSLASLLAVLIFLSSSASAATLLDDNFSDNSRAKTGALDGDWYTHASAVSTLTAASGVMKLTTSSLNMIETTFAPVTPGIGESVSVRFDLRVDRAPAVGGQGVLRFGLYDSSGTRLSGDVTTYNNTSGNNDNTGYWVVTDSRTNMPGAGNIYIEYDSLAGKAFNGNDGVNLGVSANLGDAAQLRPDAQWHTITLTVSRTAPAEYTVRYDDANSGTSISRVHVNTAGDIGTMTLEAFLEKMDTERQVEMT